VVTSTVDIKELLIQAEQMRSVGRGALIFAAVLGLTAVVIVGLVATLILYLYSQGYAFPFVHSGE
jgi:hypothetical protein